MKTRSQSKSEVKEREQGCKTTYDGEVRRKEWGWGEFLYAFKYAVSTAVEFALTDHNIDKT